MRRIVIRLAALLLLAAGAFSAAPATASAPYAGLTPAGAKAWAIKDIQLFLQTYGGYNPKRAKATVGKLNNEPARLSRVRCYGHPYWRVKFARKVAKDPFFESKRKGLLLCSSNTYGPEFSHRR